MKKRQNNDDFKKWKNSFIFELKELGRVFRAWLWEWFLFLGSFFSELVLVTGYNLLTILVYLKVSERVTFTFIDCLSLLKGKEFFIFLSVHCLFMLFVSIRYFMIKNLEQRQKFMLHMLIFSVVVNSLLIVYFTVVFSVSFGTSPTLIHSIPDFIEVKRCWTFEDLQYIYQLMIKYTGFRPDEIVMQCIFRESKTGEELIENFIKYYIEMQEKRMLQGITIILLVLCTDILLANGFVNYFQLIFSS